LLGIVNLDVSIIIVNWNTRSILRDCLRSVYERAGDIKFEVILIDNASSDGSAEMVRTEFPNATLIVNDSNRGYAGAMNQGMKIAAGRMSPMRSASFTAMILAVIKEVMKRATIATNQFECLGSLAFVSSRWFIKAILG